MTKITKELQVYYGIENVKWKLKGNTYQVSISRSDCRGTLRFQNSLLEVKLAVVKR